MKKVALSEMKDQLSKYLREAQRGDVVITLHGRPAGVLIGFESDDDWFDYRLENDARFSSRVESARRSLRAGRGVRAEEALPRAGEGAAASQPTRARKAVARASRPRVRR